MLAAERLLDLLAADADGCAQGMELLRAMPPDFRRKTLEHAVHTRSWFAVVHILADGSPDEQSRQIFALYARILLRLAELRAALGEPLPSSLPPLLHRLRDAQHNEQRDLWRAIRTQALQQRSLSAPRDPLPSLYRLLSEGLRADADALTVLVRLRERRRWLLYGEDRFFWFKGPVSLGKVPVLLAANRASALDEAAWPQRWAALSAAPTPEQIAETVHALEAPGPPIQALRAEEQQVLAALVLEQGACCPHLFGPA